MRRCGLRVASAAQSAAPSPTESDFDWSSTEALDPLPDEAFPSEIDGYTLVWTVGAPSYDIQRATVAESERISIMPHSRAIPAGEFYSPESDDSSELLPGIWCFIDTLGREACALNGTSGRLWVAIDEFETLTFDELAAWSDAFSKEIP